MARFVKSLEDPAIRRAEALGGKEPENTRCMNCTAAKPEYVCHDFRTFVCEQCQEVHMEFGHRIMAIADPEWEERDVDLVALRGGNKRAAAEWLAFWNEADFPRPAGSDQQRRRDFIRKAYVVKCWQKQPKRKREKGLKWRGDTANLFWHQARAQAAGSKVTPSQQATVGRTAAARTASGVADRQAAARVELARAPGAAVVKTDAIGNGGSTPTTEGDDFQVAERDASTSGSDSEHAFAGATVVAGAPQPSGLLPGGSAACPTRFPVLLPPAPPASRAAPVVAATAPAITPAIAVPALAVELEGEAWTADFGSPTSGLAGGRGAEAHPALCLAGPASPAAGAAPARPAMPLPPSCPASPEAYPGGQLDSELDLLRDDSNDAAAPRRITPREPITPRTRPFQPEDFHGGAERQHQAAPAGEGKLAAAGAGAQGATPVQQWCPGQQKVVADRFSAFDDMDRSEQQAPPPAEFGELLTMFNERTGGWEQKGVAPPPMGIGKVPAAPAANGKGLDSLMEAAGFGWL